MTGKTTDFTLATRANIPTTSEKGCLVHVGKADGTDGYSLGVGGTTFDDVGNNLIFEACPNQWTVLGPIGGTGWKHLAAVIDGAGAVVGFIDGAPASTLDADTDAWAAAVVTAGGSVSGGRKVAVDALIVGLKTDGVWSKLDRLWLFAAENSQSALIDLVELDQATNVNSTTFTADLGYTGNAASFYYIDSTYNPSTSATNYAQNSACIFSWSNTSGIDGGPLFGISGSVSFVVPEYTDGICYWGINTDSPYYDSVAGLGDGAGLWTVNRSGTSTANLYRNGSSVDTSTISSLAVPSANIYALREGSSWTNRQICCLGAGGSLNATEQTALYTRLRTYMNDTDVPTEVDRWESAVVAAGGSVSSGRKAVVSALIDGLIADGVWAKLDRLWLFAAENSQSALIDLVALDSATANNSPTFTADLGYACNAVANVITGYVPSANGVNFIGSEGHVSAWYSSLAQNANMSTGTAGGGSQTHIYARYVDDNCYARVANNTVAGFANATTASQHIIANRSAASATEAYKNGSSAATGTTTWVGVDTAALYAHSQETAAVSIGGSLNSTQATAFYNRLRTYMNDTDVP